MHKTEKSGKKFQYSVSQLPRQHSKKDAVRSRLGNWVPEALESPGNTTLLLNITWLSISLWKTVPQSVDSSPYWNVEQDLRVFCFCLFPDHPKIRLDLIILCDDILEECFANMYTRHFCWRVDTWSKPLLLSLACGLWPRHTHFAMGVCVAISGSYPVKMKRYWPEVSSCSQSLTCG